MKLTVKQTPYSSVVGGGLTLLNEQGRPAFMVMFIGTTNGITQEQDAALSKQFAGWITANELHVPDQPEER